MKFLTKTPRELHITKEAEKWFDRVFKGSIKDLNSETSTFYMRDEPEDPKENSSVQWMSSGIGFGNEGDICMKVHAIGTVKSKILLSFI